MQQNEPKDLYIPTDHNELLAKVLERVNSSEEIKTLWKVINVNAIDRLNMSDHGIVHFQIVANSALRISRILNKNNVDLSIKKDFGLTNHHGEVVIFLASVMHDLGMTIHRKGHEEYSLFIVNTLLRELLDFMPVYERTIIISETLHAIIGHRKDGTPLTLEAGIVRVADALDMSEGRARVSFETSSIDIYNLSVESIESVKIHEGKEKFIRIEILMHNSSGIFQVDELLKEKIKGSGLEKYVQVYAKIETENEKKMLDEFVMNF